MTDPPIDTIIDRLWSRGEGSTERSVYALLDGARDPCIAPLLHDSGVELCCLYSGKCSQRLLNAAPYLLRLQRDALFTRTLLEQAWGHAWGIFTRVPPEVSLEQQREHFRSLLRVRDEAGRKLVFRFYDPRVLRVYLPTCTGAEAKQVFGPVSRLLAEDEAASGLIEFRQVEGGIAASMIALNEALGAARAESPVHHTQT